MGVINLAILEPINGASFVGSGSVRLRGQVLSSGHPPLFFKWYSSLVAPIPPSTDASIPLPGGADPLDFTPPLPLGSQVLTLAAKDQPGESEPELQRVADAGMAGGPPGTAPTPCLIHVLIANLREPAAAGAPLSKASGPLAAQAPPLWPEATYQARNDLQFRWRFTPVGPPAGRATAEFVPALVFDPSGSPPVVRYTGPLPAQLGTGTYRLTLRVERISNTAVGHEVSRDVVLQP
jgi:hypothetical protein